MTEQDYIDTLPFETQQLIKEHRAEIPSPKLLRGYILVDKEVIEDHPLVVAVWMSRNEFDEVIIVNRDEINDIGTLSTVFIPVMVGNTHFETAMLGKQQTNILARYRTYAEAEAGHIRYLA